MIATDERILQVMKLVEFIFLLVSWTSATDLYHDEQITVDGRLAQLSFFIIVAVIAWIFTVIWFILNITKVCTFDDVTPTVNTVIHLVLASLILTASILMIDGLPLTQNLYTKKGGGGFGLASALLMIVDAITFLNRKRKIMNH